MIALDTNVLVRFLVGDDEEQAARAAAVLGALTPEAPGFVPTVVWVETFWVLTRTYRVDRRVVAERLAALALADEIRAEDGRAVAEAAAAVLSDDVDFSDALIASAARRAGSHEVVTFDRAASKRLGWRLL